MALVELARQALYLTLTLSVPVLAASFAAGAVTGLFATAMRLHDASVTHLPRQLAVGAVLLASGASGAALITRFAWSLWAAIPSLVP